MESIDSIGIGDIIDSLNQGVYVCDPDRTITYWSRQAERITGWTPDDVVGKRCCDNVLCHIDKDGHLLCGEEHCPLHRAMVTGVGSTEPLLVFARAKQGGRVPMHVSVSPIHNRDGVVIGGVETFSDASSTVHDLERAKAIQQLALRHDLPDDPRITFTTHYIPHSVIGGDYFTIEALDDDHYGLMLADVMGHGIAAALYTMHLSQLSHRLRHELVNPAAFACRLNNELVELFSSDQSFATAVCAVIDLAEREIRMTGAGGPQVLLTRADGRHELLENPGLPLAVMPDAEYEQITAPINDDDRLLLFSDGALEVQNVHGEQLGAAGLFRLLEAQGYPAADIDLPALEESLLRFSNAIRLPDDLTLIEIRFGER
jgi:PAS domain S-box-containing protein